MAFVQMMIPHHAQALEMSRLAQTRAAHDGVVAMAQTTARDGVDAQVAEMAAEVSTGQAAEIARMRELLGSI